MAVKLRLRREGTKKKPHFRVVAADHRSPRDGRFIEILGAYHPREEPSRIEIEAERALYWLRNGAQPTSSVENLLRVSGIWAQFKPDDTEGRVDNPKNVRTTLERPEEEPGEPEEDGEPEQVDEAAESAPETDQDTDQETGSAGEEDTGEAASTDTDEPAADATEETEAAESAAEASTDEEEEGEVQAAQDDDEQDDEDQNHADDEDDNDEDDNDEDEEENA